MTWNTLEAPAMELQQELDESRIVEQITRPPKGIWLTVSGFVVAVLGMILYCTVSLGGNAPEQVGMEFLQYGNGQVAISLGIIGLGVLLWFIGSFRQLSDLMLEETAGHDGESAEIA